MSAPRRPPLSGASSDDSQSRHRFVVALLVTALLWLGLAGTLLAPAVSERAKEIVSDVIFVPISALVAVSAGWRARRSAGRIRRAWALMGLAGGLWAIAEATWFALHYLASAQPPNPSVADIFYLAALPPAAVALILFPPTGPPGWQRIRTLLGSLVVAGAVLFVSRALALTVIFPGTGEPWLARAVFVAYPIADVVLASLALIMLIRTGARPPIHLSILALGFLSYSIADTVYAHQAAQNTYVSGSVVDLGWAMGYLLFSLAAFTPHASDEPHEVPRPATGRHTGISSLLVYIPLLAAVVVASARPSPVTDPVLIVSGLSILVLFGARQALLVADNSRLRDDLERRVAQLQDSGTELRRLAQQNERILQSVADGVIGVDADGRITFVNARAAEMVGIRPIELLATPVLDRFHRSAGAPANSTFQSVRTALSTGTMLAAATGEFARAGTSPFPVDLAVGPIVERGSILGAVLVFRDVSARRAVEKMKDEFVSVVSHELRTPLTSIRGSLGLIASGMAGPLNDRGQRMATIALESSKRLTRLIDEMLDLERMEAGSLRMRLARWEAAALVDTAVEEVRILATDHGVEIRTAQLSGYVRADSDRVVQTLTNLMGNAIKFSPAGTSIDVSAVPVDGMVEFAVTDHGRGIPADQLSRVFERFEQVDSSDSRALGGTGLGLTICRDIVGLHGGRIWASSVLGQGSTFRFTLPTGDQPAADPGGAADSEGAADSATATVLGSVGA